VKNGGYVRLRDLSAAIESQWEEKLIIEGKKHDFKTKIGLCAGSKRFLRIARYSWWKDRQRKLDEESSVREKKTA